jgi:glucose/arabinose dehydrogenase
MTRKRNFFRPRINELEDRRTPATFADTNFAETNIGAATNGTQMEFSPDGKLYVLEQAGTMKVFQGSGTSWTEVAPGSAPNQNFFTGSPLTVDSNGERGLLGIAFDPNYLSNHYLYCYYTATTPAVHNRISRFTANAAGTQVVAGSEAILMDLDNLSGATNHNGGGLHFGPDGKLYVSVGENANGANSQSISNRLGKILRLNPDPANPIPADNPTSFPNIAGTTTGNNRAIWAVGLRNPFTFAFQPGAVPTRMYINDVGNSTWEEIDNGVGGVNYGWSTVEGPSPAGVSGMTYPFLWYNHTDSTMGSPTSGYTGFAIVGGTFYNAANYTFPSDYPNDYFFGDEVSSWIRRYDYTTNSVSVFATGTGNASDLRTGPDGSLYYLSRASSAVFRVRYTAAIAPYIVTQPLATQSVSEGKPVTFSVVAGGSGTLTYRWQRNNVDISGATGSSYTISSASLGDNGATFRVIISGAGTNATSNATTLTVNPNQSPVPTILTPTAGSHFNYGDTVNYSGSATDPEDGVLSAAAFTWSVDYFTGGVPTQVVPPTSGSMTGQFTIPTMSAYTAPDVFYRIHLVVHDTNNATTEVTRDLMPNLVDVTLASNPAGAQLTLDGVVQSAPYTFTGVTGLTRSIGASPAATIGGLAYGFSAWSDAGALVHNLSTPGANTTYTANYVVRPPRVSDFRIDDGTIQRSMVRSLQLTFDAIVNYSGLPTDAFALTGPGGSYGLAVGATDNSSGHSIVNMTFTGPGLDNTSLPNGLYVFTVFGSQLVDGLAQNLDGDANGSAGGNYVSNFHRLFGDADGDSNVGANDFALFRMAYLTSTGPGFISGFDVNNNGIIDAADFARFRQAFGGSI